MNIAVVGIGYVGLSLACLLARDHDVCAVDIVPEKVDLVNNRKSPFADAGISEALATQNLRLSATCDARSAYLDADIVIIAVPTDYSAEHNYFDTSAVEDVLATLDEMNFSGLVVIRSTTPVGFTAEQAQAHPSLELLFSPEFLREGQALSDNLHPSRIIVGVPRDDASLAGKARTFADLLAQAAEEDAVETRIVGSSEAEAIKLFSNTYLALRVAFFNELDTYALSRGLDAGGIIDGVGLDPRIGSYYNNPSFGYGGYCLPKDSKQLLANYEDVPQNIMQAIVSSNATRKDYIADQVAALEPACVGIYRLAMKEGSDNYRNSSVLGIMERLAQRGIAMLVYDPACPEAEVVGARVTDDLDELKRSCDVIICNRYEPALDDVRDKVYTRDRGSVQP